MGKIFEQLTYKRQYDCTVCTRGHSVLIIIGEKPLKVIRYRTPLTWARARKTNKYLVLATMWENEKMSPCRLYSYNIAEQAEVWGTI